MVGVRSRANKKRQCFHCLLMVGATGFEPATPCSRSKCATRLRYAPKFQARRVIGASVGFVKPSELGLEFLELL